MKIIRIDSYDDSRFSAAALRQHGCFLAGGAPYEVEIISDFEAVIRGVDAAVYPQVIDEFRFYAPHVTTFRNEVGNIVRELPRLTLLTIPIDKIQPSQFFVDEDKVAAVGTFIREPRDIVIQVLPWRDRYISLDGHTRLYYAVTQGWDSVRGVVQPSDDGIYRFVEEANRRGILTPRDMALVSHAEYEERWNRFCAELLGSSD